MKKVLKKVAAAALAVAMTAAAMPQEGYDTSLFSDVLVADAAGNAFDWLEYDKNTYTMTITGTPKAITKDTIVYRGPNISYYYASEVWYIKIKSAVALPENCEGLFSAYSNVKSIDISGADTRNVVNMSEMFRNLNALTTVNLSSCDVSKTTNMDYMFAGCTSLKTITGISALATSGLKTANYMFSSCSSLQSLDLTGFDTSKLTAADGMFTLCSALNKLTLGGDFKKIETSYSLPNGDGWVNEKDQTKVVSGTGTYAAITNTGTNTYIPLVKMTSSYKFDESTGLLTLTGDINKATLSDIPKDKVKKIVAKEGTVIKSGLSLFSNFENCTEIDLSKSVLSGTILSSAFDGCKSLTKLDISGWDTSKVTNIDQAFYGCKSLKELDLSRFSTASVKSSSFVFFDCDSLNKLTLGSNFKKIDSSFTLDIGEYGWSKATAPLTIVSTVGYDSWNRKWAEIENSGTTTYYKDYAIMPNTDCYNFNSTSGLLTLKNAVDRDTIKNFADKESVKRVTADSSAKFVGDVSGMFAEYKNCTDIDLSNVDTSRATDMSHLFRNCISLKEIDLTGVDTQKVTSMYMMFYGCSALETIDLSGFNTANVTDMGYMFAYNYALKSIVLSSFNTKNVISMQYMFFNCHALTELNLTHFNTAQVTEMQNMFAHCTGLESVNLSSFNTAKCTNFKGMFSDCFALTELGLATFNTKSAENMEEFFKNCANLKKIILGADFGDIAEAMKLPNGDGWANKNDIKTVISGSEPYAVITNKEQNTYQRITKIAAEPYNLTGLGYPAPGTKVKDSLAGLKPVSDMYTIDKENTGWVDAHTGEMLKADDVFLFGGAYFLAVRLVPQQACYFAEPTEMSLVQSKIYASDGITQFCDGYRYSGILNDDGSLEFTAQLSDYCNTTFVGYEYPDGRKAVAFPLLGLKVTTPDAHTIMVGTMYMNSTYQEPTGAPDYECSIDKETWYNLAEINGIGIQKLKSDTEYTVYLRTVGAEEPFDSRTVKTPASEEAEPIFKIDITDVTAPNALEKPVRTATVSGDGALLCKDSEIAEFGTDGMSWTDDDGTGKAMSADAKYLAGQKYTVRVLISAADGYAFPAELSDITATVNGKTASVLPSEDGKTVIVTYQFTATGTNEVSVTFNANGGSGTMAADSVNAYAEYKLPECGFTAPATKEFAGWKIGEKVYAAGDTVTFDGNATVTAVWEAIKYTLTFDANGGNGEMKPVKGEINSEIALPACTFTFNNKRFTGWFVNGVMMQAGDKVKLTENLMIFAMWEFNNVTITLNANGGEGSMANTVLLSGTVYPLPACSFSAPEGKQFAGWQLGDNTYQPGDSFTVTKSVTVKALWEAASITVLMGDVSGDGTVDQADAILLSRYAAAWEGVELDLKAADLNDDGTADNADAMILARYVAGWEGYDKYIVSKTV